MRVHTAGRGAGKTHELVRELSRDHRSVLLVHPGALDFARSLGIEKFHMTRRDVISRIQPHDVDPQRLRGYNYLLIDNAEAMLRGLLSRQGIAMEVTDISIEGDPHPRQYADMRSTVDQAIDSGIAHRLSPEQEAAIDKGIADGSIFSSNAHG